MGRSHGLDAALLAAGVTFIIFLIAQIVSALVHG
jgi:hypothetical protein